MTLPQLPSTPAAKAPTAPAAPTAAAQGAAAAAAVPGPSAFSIAGAKVGSGRIPALNDFSGSFWLRIADFQIRTMRNGLTRMSELTVEVVNVLTPTTQGVHRGSTMTLLHWENARYPDIFRDQVATQICAMWGADSNDDSLDLDAMLTAALSDENPTVGLVMAVDVIHKEAVNKDGSPRLNQNGEQVINKSFRYSGLVSDEQVSAAGL